MARSDERPEPFSGEFWGRLGFFSKFKIEGSCVSKMELPRWTEAGLFWVDQAYFDIFRMVRIFLEGNPNQK